MQPAHHRRKAAGRQLIPLGLLAYAVLLGAVVFWPQPVDRGVAGHLDRLFGLLQSLGAPGWVDYALLESSANVLLFVPAGLLLAAWLSPRWSWLAAVAGLCGSAVVEAAQSLLLPERFGTPQDVIANGLGAALGTIAVYAWRSVPDTAEKPEKQTG